jgi:excisionase family DNA binding protein
MSFSPAADDLTGTDERLMMPGEVADLFRVDPKTVTRWAACGRLDSVRTPGGRYRFPESAVRAHLRPAGRGTHPRTSSSHAPSPVKAR